MEINKKIRKGVVESLPEAKQIVNKELRERVYDAWAMALDKSGYTKIEDMSLTPNVYTEPLKGGTQVDHFRSVTRIAAIIAKELKDNVAQFRIDMDEVIAGGLCHDLGKPFEFDPKNHERWKSNPEITGYPSLRHPTYGVHIALSAGLPEKIAHIVGAHSREGNQLNARSIVGEIVHHADHCFWRVLRHAGLLHKGR